MHGVRLWRYLHPQACRGELLGIAVVEAVLPHQRGEVLQAVRVALGRRQVQQVVALLVQDQLQVISRKVGLGGEERKRGRRGRGGRSGHKNSQMFSIIQFVFHTYYFDSVLTQQWGSN